MIVKRNPLKPQSPKALYPKPPRPEASTELATAWNFSPGKRKPRSVAIQPAIGFRV